MAVVVKKFQMEIGTATRRTGVTEASLSASVTIFESLPSDEDVMKKDGGAASYEIPFSFVVDDAFVFLVWLLNNNGTKQDWLLRPAEGAAAAANPQLSGTSGASNQAVVDFSGYNITNGGGIEGNGTLHLDGAPTITAP